MKHWTFKALASTLLMCASVPFVAAQDIRNGLILLYEFEEGSGDIVGDTSGFGAALDLTVQDSANVSWGNGFLTVDAPTIITNENPPQKIFDAVIPVNEVSVEAWVTPANAALFGAARIFNIATDVPADATTNRDLLLGQDNANIDFRLRTTTTSNNGIPELNSDAGGPVVTEPTELLHLLYTRDNAGAATLYVDGQEWVNADVGGDFSNWDESYRLALAHEFADPSADSRSWQGDYHLIAMWNRALSDAEVMDRFSDGPVAPGGMPLVAGDVNGDGMVTMDDYEAIRDNFLSEVTSRAEGDLNFDRMVDWADFREWKTEFLAAGGNLAAIPEPNSMILTIVAATLLLLGRRSLRPTLVD